MVNIKIKEVSQPCVTNVLSWEEFIFRTGINPLRLSELVEMDWINYAVAGDNTYLFPEKEVYRVRKLLRICRDFELSTLAGMIIVDLLERIECLERKLSQI
ncbi:MAG: chaperone modulator CbpM [Desulfonauticus sp.]|nr:chaperone modulator CbpM [Desulfonauticus sp.]